MAMDAASARRRAQLCVDDPGHWDYTSLVNMEWAVKE